MDLCYLRTYLEALIYLKNLSAISRYYKNFLRVIVKWQLTLEQLSVQYFLLNNRLID